MADVREGLGSSDLSEHDLGSDAGFTAALAKLAGTEVPEETLEALGERDTSIQSGLTTEESTPDRSRDDQGRFAKDESAAQESETKVEEGAAPEKGEAEVDPFVAALLEKHGGDPTAAIADLRKQNEEAQSFSGKQSQEVGELRERLARLEGAQQAQQDRPAAPLPMPSQDDIVSVVARYDGPSAVTQAADAGYPDGHPIFDRIFEAWIAQDDTGQASGAYQRYLAMQMRGDQRPVEQTAPAVDPWVAQKKLEEEIEGVFNDVASSYGKDWALIKPHLSSALDDPNLALIRKTLYEGTRDEKKNALKSFAEIAQARAVADATAKAREEAASSATATKRAAQVATGSLRLVQERESGDTSELTKAEREALFHQKLLGTETTSVRDGLTFAKTS